MNTNQLLVVAVGLVVSQSASANIYRYADETGRVFFSSQSHTPRPAKVNHVVKHKKLITAHNKVEPKRWYTKAHIAKIVKMASAKHHVEEKLLHAVIQTESSYKADAISKVGAVGLMQLMPKTAARFGVVDRTDPTQSIEGGTRYLKHLLHLFNGNKRLAIASYNAGENAVIRHNRSIPPYPETIAYVSSVMNRYNSN
jgi:soluble lytic murein transglycosylase-like protein